MDHLTIGDGNKMAAVLAGDERALHQLQEGEHLMRQIGTFYDVGVREICPPVGIAENVQQGEWLKAGVEVGMAVGAGGKLLDVASGVARGLRAAKGTGPRITEAGLRRIEGHLGNLNALDDAANQAMLARLRAGQTTTHDVNFYMHELKESARMKGLDYSNPAVYNAAHKATLQWQGVPYNAAASAQVYHPDVIRHFSDSFNKAAWPQ